MTLLRCGEPPRLVSQAYTTKGAGRLEPAQIRQDGTRRQPHRQHHPMPLLLACCDRKRGARSCSWRRNGEPDFVGGATSDSNDVSGILLLYLLYCTGMRATPTLDRSHGCYCAQVDGRSGHTDWDRVNNHPESEKEQDWTRDNNGKALVPIHSKVVAYKKKKVLNPRPLHTAVPW